jgi:hypothetical protein
VNYLAPGESTPFRVFMAGQAGGTPFFNFQAYAYAIPAAELPVSALTLSDVYAFLDEFGQLHMVGEVANAGETALLVRLVASIYDQTSSVLDAALVDVPLPLLPGARLPFDLTDWGPVNVTPDLYYNEGSYYTVQVDPYWLVPAESELIALTPGAFTFTPAEYSATYTGAVRNESGGPLTDIITLVILRDLASGVAIGMGIDYGLGVLEAGQEAAYTIVAPIQAGTPAESYVAEVIAYGYRPTP